MCAAETEALTSRAEQEFRHNALMAKKEQEVSELFSILFLHRFGS